MIKFAKIFIPFTIILLIFFVISNNVSAELGDMWICQSNIDLNYDEEAANKPVLPVNMTIDIPIQFKYYIDGLYAKHVAYNYYSNGHCVYIYIYVENVSEWADATISPQNLMIPATVDGITDNLTLTVKINRSAHAFDKGIATIRFDVKNMGSVKGGDIYKDISFTAGYLPFLEIDLPQGNAMTIRPDETADFDIKLENLGNAKTNVNFTILDVPEGWSAKITQNILLGTTTIGENIDNIVTLSVKPSYEFGYHNEEEIIKVLINPSHYKESDLVGPTYELSFIIQNKGYFVPGFEVISIFLALTILVFILKGKRKTKQSSKKSKYGGNDI
jgi:hypothetical protein